MGRTTGHAHVPLRVRDRCVEGLEQMIPQIVELGNSDVPASVKLSAFDKLGKFGLSGRNTVLIEHPTVVRACLDLIAEMFSATEAQLTLFSERIAEELTALAGAEIDLEDESDGDD